MSLQNIWSVIVIGSVRSIIVLRRRGKIDSWSGSKLYTVNNIASSCANRSVIANYAIRGWDVTRYCGHTDPPSLVDFLRLIRIRALKTFSARMLLSLRTIAHTCAVKIALRRRGWLPMRAPLGGFLVITEKRLKAGLDVRHFAQPDQ